MRPWQVLASVVVLAAPASAPGTTLRGSPASMVRQHQVAVSRDYSFARSGTEVRRLAALGKLVPLRGGSSYRLSRVSHPYARREVRTLVERLGPAYQAACGESLVVTSLTRPKSEQPGNAHQLSVHPAGMAVDLRISRSAKCRRWLEARLLAMERKGEVDATREKRPPHYHIAVLSPNVGSGMMPPPRRGRAATPSRTPLPGEPPVPVELTPMESVLSEPAPPPPPVEIQWAAVGSALLLLLLAGGAAWLGLRR
jgi:hypothetical protein